MNTEVRNAKIVTAPGLVQSQCVLSSNITSSLSERMVRRLP